MDNITEYIIDKNVEHSKWISLQRIYYKQDGISKSWDMAISNDSVCCLLYHPKKQCFLLVKQFRPPVFARQLVESTDPSAILKPRLSFELCAGLLDKAGKSPIETMQAEILEECGYDVPLQVIQPINSYFGSVAKNYAMQYLFYAEIVEDGDADKISKKVNNGGGLASEGEMIEVVELPIFKAKEFMMDESIVRSSVLLFGISWWFLEKATPQQYEMYYKNK